MKKNLQFKWLCMLLFFLGISMSASASVSESAEFNTPGNGTLTDSNIQFIGRWDKSNANYYHGHWTGATIRVDFTGKSIKINLQNQDYIWLIVQIDNEAPRAVLANNGKELSLGNLQDGRHTIVIGEGIVNAEILFKGFTLETGAVTYKPTPKLLIEFIGDSITTIGGPGGMFSYNYAWRVADQLGCDHTQISYSGLALCSGYSVYEQNRVGMDSLYFGLKNYEHFVNKDNATFYPWNFSTYTPDIVFMFLGTNDSDGVPWEFNATDAVFKQRLDKFLKRIRGKFPNAHIAVMNPFTGVFKNVIDTHIKEMKLAGEKRLHFINSTGWLTKPDDFDDGIHLNAQGTNKVINKLYYILAPIVQSIKDGTEYEDPNEPGDAEKFYLIPSADWLSNDAKVGAIFKNGTTEEKVMFSLNSSIGMYQLFIPDGTWTQVCMKRYAPDGVSDWGGFATYDPVNEVQVNNFIPYDGTFNRIEVEGWADGTNPAQYILSTYSDAQPQGITIRFKKPTTWSIVNVHAWDAVGAPLPGFSWPGNAMTENPAGSGWYEYKFDPSVLKVSFQFNKGDADGLIVKEYVTESTSYNNDGSVATSIQNEKISFRVQVENSQISVQSEDVTNVEIYSIMGQLIHSESSLGSFSRALESGIYLLRVNGHTQKLLIP